MWEGIVIDSPKIQDCFRCVDKGGGGGQNEKSLSKRAFREQITQRVALVPEWRNWQTRQVQDLVLAREWRFESSFGHHNL